MLGSMLLTLHNINFYQELMNSIRKKELSDEITKLKAERLKSNL